MVVRVADAIPGAAAANLPELAVFEGWYEEPKFESIDTYLVYVLEALALS